ncbi:MAG: ImmA/IrrE family metallo-endopeptidase [Sphingomonas sp.]
MQRVALTLGAEIRALELADDISGVLYRDLGRRIIVVNRTHSEVRRRFTIAHELGHLALHRGDKVHVDHEFRVNLRDPRSATAENVEEVEANAFAANLLMPAEWIWAELDQHLIDPGDDSQISALAERYCVSQQALLIRVATLSSAAGEIAASRSRPAKRM